MSVLHSDDNCSYHDASGDGGQAVDWVYGGCGYQPELKDYFGIFHINDIPATFYAVCSPHKYMKFIMNRNVQHILI